MENIKYGLSSGLLIGADSFRSHNDGNVYAEDHWMESLDEYYISHCLAKAIIETRYNLNDRLKKTDILLSYSKLNDNKVLGQFDLLITSKYDTTYQLDSRLDPKKENTIRLYISYISSIYQEKVTNMIKIAPTFLDERYEKLWNEQIVDKFIQLVKDYFYSWQDNEIKYKLKFEKGM